MATPIQFCFLTDSTVFIIGFLLIVKGCKLMEYPILAIPSIICPNKKIGG